MNLSPVDCDGTLACLFSGFFQGLNRIHFNSGCKSVFHDVERIAVS